MLANTAPNRDQIEITLFGPGFGECCVVHYGENRWLIVDSCLDSRSGEPVAIVYLDHIGVAHDNVRYIVASHWHADHVGGLAKTLRACRQAQFCASSALTADEFLANVSAHAQMTDFSGGKGVTEFFAVVGELRSTRRLPYLAMAANQRLCNLPSLYNSAGKGTSIWSLSPSPGQIQQFLLEMAAQIPALGATKLRATPQGENHLSVVLMLEFDDVAVLLGADLEETLNPHTGWTPIVNSQGRPITKASVFKVPHHGSANAHSAEAWANMLGPQPLSILTPYVRLRSPIPTEADQRRIRSLSSQAFLTAPARGRKIQQASHEVTALLRKLNMHMPEAEPETGAVRVRNRGVDGPNQWTTECGGGAFEITQDLADKA